MLDLKNRELDFNNYNEVYEFLLGCGYTKRQIDTFLYYSTGDDINLEKLDRFIASQRNAVLKFLRRAGRINYEVNTVKDYYYLDGGKELYLLNQSIK